MVKRSVSWSKGQSRGQKVSLVVKRSRVRVPAGAAGEFLPQDQLSVRTLISASVPPPCYRSSTYKIPVILPKVLAAGYVSYS